MDLVAYNLRLGGSGAHWQALEASFAPDVVLAQESLPPPAAPGPGTTCWAAVPGRRWGSAIALRAGRLVPVPVPGYEGWVVAADVEGLTSGSVRVVSVHVPAGPGGYVAVADRILDRLAPRADGRPLLLGGDFNVLVGRPVAGERPRKPRAQLALLDRLEREFGLVPAGQRAHPGRALAQTLRWTGNPVTPYHCDGVFVPTAWADAGVEARVVSGGAWTRLSDHNPVVVRVPAPESGGNATSAGRASSPT